MASCILYGDRGRVFPPPGMLPDRPGLHIQKQRLRALGYSVEYGEIRSHGITVNPSDGREHCNQRLLCEILGDTDVPSGRAAVFLFDVRFFFLSF